MTFLGLVVMENRLKPETTPIILQLRDAKIRPVMITGKNQGLGQYKEVHFYFLYFTYIKFISLSQQLSQSYFCPILRQNAKQSELQLQKHESRMFWRQVCLLIMICNFINIVQYCTLKLFAFSWPIQWGLLTKCQLNLKKQSSVKFQSKYNDFHSRICITVYSRYIDIVYITELDISQSHVAPHFLAPKSRIFFAKSFNTLDPIRGRQFSAIAFVPGSLETIFRKINSGLPVNAGYNTCCAMVSQARRSINTSIVSQSRARLIQCQCKSRLQMANLGINNAFLIKSSLVDHTVYIHHLVQTLR